MGRVGSVGEEAAEVRSSHAHMIISASRLLCTRSKGAACALERHTMHCAPACDLRVNPHDVHRKPPHPHVPEDTSMIPQRRTMLHDRADIARRRIPHDPCNIPPRYIRCYGTCCRALV